MNIESPVFQNGEKIPRKYTCEGENINPPLMFIQVPKTAKSLALIVDDFDVPKSLKPDGLWNHWLVWNMPPETKGVGEGMTPPGIQGRGSGNKAAYQGPCPPDREHRYQFRLYALDAMLELDPQTARRDELLEALETHILETVVLEGRYEKSRK